MSWQRARDFGLVGVAGRNGETAVVALYEVADGVGCVVVVVSVEPDVSTTVPGSWGWRKSSYTSTAGTSPSSSTTL